MKRLCKHFLTALWLSSLLAVILTGCGGDESPTFEKQPGLADEQSDSVRIVSTKNNNVEYILNARHIQRFYNSRTLDADTVRVESFDQDGHLRSVLTGREAVMDEVKNILTAQGNVIIVNDENDTLKTEHLVWNRNTDAIFAKGKVTIIRGENIFHGHSLQTDTSFRELRSVNVAGSGKVEKEELPDE